MAPMVANGDRHCRQWMSPLAPMAIVIAIGATDRIAIGDNGASIGAIYCRHWRQWRQMLHSPNYLTLLPFINCVILPFIKCVIKFGEWIIWRHWRQWRQQMAPMDAPLSPMAIRSVAPMAITIAIGANGDIHWRQWRSPLTTIGAI